MNKYAIEWDRYVKANPATPGEEWGTPDFWNAQFKELFLKEGAMGWRHAIEIGAGVGKYTTRLLTSNRNVKVLAMDVSMEFIRMLDRIIYDNPVTRYRVTSYWIDYIYEASNGCSPMMTALEFEKWPKVDAVYSIDALVHVEFPIIANYIASSMSALKPGGKFIATMAGVENEAGMNKMLSDTKLLYETNLNPPGKFNYVSTQMLEKLCTAVGASNLDVRTTTRDLQVIITK